MNGIANLPAKDNAEALANMSYEEFKKLDLKQRTEKIFFTLQAMLKEAKIDS